MPNIFEMLRLKNIFGQPEMIGNDLPSQGGITGNMPQPNMGPEMGGLNFDMFGPPKPSPWDNVQIGPQVDLTQPQVQPQMAATPDTGFDVTRRMGELYTPETAAGERFNTMIGEQPRAQDYKPGAWRSIAAALSAFGPGGHETGMQVAMDPFTRKAADWEAGIKPAQAAANIERQSNINERTLAYQTVSQELRQRADEARANKDEARTKIMQDRADVYRLKSIRPNFKFDFSGPEVLVSDPTTGKVERTGISTGSLSDADKLAMQQEQALERIGATGAEARETEGVRQTGRETIAETRGWQVANIPDPANPGQQIAVKINQITGEVMPITMGDKPIGPVARPSAAGGRGAESPAQLKVRQFNSARQLASTRPDLAKFIKLGTGNNFTIVQPGRFSGPTPEQFEEINTSVFGGGPLIQQPTRTGAPSTVSTTPPSTRPVANAPLTKTQTNSRTGEKRTLISTDGGKTWQVQGAPTAAR